MDKYGRLHNGPKFTSLCIIVVMSKCGVGNFLNVCACCHFKLPTLNANISSVHLQWRSYAQAHQGTLWMWSGSRSLASPPHLAKQSNSALARGSAQVCSLKLFNSLLIPLTAQQYHGSPLSTEFCLWCVNIAISNYTKLKIEYMGFSVEAHCRIPYKIRQQVKNVITGPEGYPFS